MVWIPGGTFRMGSEDFYPEERPVHEVTVDDFWIDRSLITNAQFARFVEATGYVTLAERPPNPADFAGAPAENLVPGSMVFQNTTGPVDLRNYANWWAWVPGTSWRRPRGPRSSLKGLAQHPVVHVAYEDAEAYAHWAGKELPTEAEWECAARAGLDSAKFTWGDEHFPDGKAMGNTWQGEFPWQNLLLAGTRGRLRSAPSHRTPMDCTIWPAMCGNGPATGTFTDTQTRSSNPVAVQPSIHASSRRRKATIRVSRSSTFRAKSSRAARTCARPTTVCATAQPRGNHR
jgi:formylglycine-generating enzyme required for sulfatase activity